MIIIKLKLRRNGLKDLSSEQLFKKSSFIFNQFAGADQILFQCEVYVSCAKIGTSIVCDGIEIPRTRTRGTIGNATDFF